MAWQYFYGNFLNTKIYDLGPATYDMADSDIDGSTGEITGPLGIPAGWTHKDYDDSAWTSSPMFVDLDWSDVNDGSSPPPGEQYPPFPGEYGVWSAIVAPGSTHMGLARFRFTLPRGSYENLTHIQSNSVLMQTWDMNSSGVLVQQSTFGPLGEFWINHDPTIIGSGNGWLGYQAHLVEGENVLAWLAPFLPFYHGIGFLGGTIVSHAPYWPSNPWVTIAVAVDIRPLASPARSYAQVIG